MLGYQPGGCGKNPGKSNEKDLKYIIKGEMEREVIKRKCNRFFTEQERNGRNVDKDGLSALDI